MPLDKPVIVISYYPVADGPHLLGRRFLSSMVREDNAFRGIPPSREKLELCFLFLANTMNSVESLLVVPLRPSRTCDDAVFGRLQIETGSSERDRGYKD